MRVDDLIYSDDSREELLLLNERCSQFVEEAGNAPLLMNLPTKYGDFHKVKVRKRRQHKNEEKAFTETFNDAFTAEMWNLRERAVFTNGEESFEPADTLKLEPFYIFPIDEYRFMYSSEIENSSYDYKTVFDTLFEEFGTHKGNEIINDLLKFTYTYTQLREGIKQGSEIILFNIPYFYAIRCSTVDNYDKLLTSIKEL